MIKFISKYKSIIAFMLLFIITISAKGQTHDDDYYTKAVDFFQGEGILEAWFIEEFLPLYDTFMLSQYGELVIFGQAIAGLGALLYLGLIGWQMQTGERQWEITSILKPFAIGLVLMNWTLFVQGIKAPLVALQNYAQESFQEEQHELNTIRITRYKWQMLLVDASVREQAKAALEVDQQKDGNKQLWEYGVEFVEDGFNSLVAPVYEAFFKLQISFQLAITALVEILALWALRLCVYLIFFIQIIFSTILIIVGPISIGISVFPVYANSFSTWVARFININLYGFIAFLVMKIGVLLQKFAYEAEIERFEKILNSDGTVKDMALLESLISNGVMSFGLVVVCFLVSAIGVLCTPTLANYVISAGSNSGAMSKLKQAGQAVMSKGTSLIK